MEPHPTRSTTTKISPETWQRLVDAEKKAVTARWSDGGVFAAAVGPRYLPGSPDSLLYVGKSGGPCIDGVGLSQDYASSAAATTDWMLGRRNGSAFWHFLDQLTGSRDHVAWSNLVKVDCKGSGPPRISEWRQIREACLDALREELDVLRPSRVVFVTGGYGRTDILGVLRDAGYTTGIAAPALEDVECLEHGAGRLAVISRHPQGWKSGSRDRVAEFLTHRSAA